MSQIVFYGFEFSEIVAMSPPGAPGSVKRCSFLAKNVKFQAKPHTKLQNKIDTLQIICRPFLYLHSETATDL
ncbi:hypothetical protein C5O25_06355 [Paramuribaculum intestinale]|uniref:Uncharacterized protein n=1 Tax=Paramuribaculum intestinale TaxID=2094151 RepID=A0A2V1ISS9_9BACT|nr:hypothetical protein C5O24_10315 [Paramuribaculum intestinale]PWB07753.1 hypothetical protein C5O25_06355 [Paramuribaculum intestinale]ROS93341.1 hypothetical protein EEL36_04080 [Muribaculaceae bacterium Isolate-043 (Harlan)]ROT14400.1 hypothetical protein EEL50_07920 [Muribaculaceae bacterium Isolate-105 (HZI)]